MSLPPSEVPQGAIRFNTDSQRLEFYAQGEWWVMSTDTPNLGTSADSTPGARGLSGGGGTDRIDYINISSTGDAIDFGNLSTSIQIISSFGSSTRAFWAGGREGSTRTNRIQKVTFASTGDATDFGDLGTGKDYPMGASNSTRGLIAGGYPHPGSNSGTNSVEYVTMASTGAGKDFGYLTGARSGGGGTSNSTRSIFYGNSQSVTNIVDFFTITTLGDAQSFGELSFSSAGGGANTNSVRAVVIAGNDGANRNHIDYVTITSTGNGVDFSDLTLARRFVAAMGSPTRSVFAGGYTNPEGALNVNNIDYVEFATLADAIDFGDLTNTRGGTAGCSNAHGGL